jgi:hypothetical protein
LETLSLRNFRAQVAREGPAPFALPTPAIGKSDPFIAHRALSRLLASNLELELVAAYLSCCNRLDEAAELLEKARAHGYRSVAATKLHIELLYRAGKYTAARALAQAEREALPARDWQIIENALGK